MIMGYRAREEASSVPSLFTSLSKIIAGDLDCSHLAIKDHSVDGSPYSVRPQAILYPKTVSDIKHAISFAREYQIPLTPCGGMTARSGGALSEGIIIDMSRYFSHIKNMNMMEHTVTVDAGVSVNDLREKLTSWNMEIPVLQGEHPDATIGGLVATKSATGSTFYAGTIREWIEGITVVVDSGEEHHLKDGISPSGRLLGIYQSLFPMLSEASPTLRAARREESDDATGYSLWNMSIGPRQLLDELVGSEGTLAIITSITFRVVQKKRHQASFLIPIHDPSLVQTYIDICKHHQTEYIFLFDETYRKLTDTFHAGLIDGSVPITFLTLIVTLTGEDVENMVKKSKMLSKAIPSTTLYPLELKTKELLTSYTFLDSLFQSYFKRSHMVATAGEGIIVPLHSYAKCLESIDDTLSLTGRKYCITGYAGSGHISVICGFDSQSLAYEHDLQEYRESLFSIVRAFKGGISAVNGDGLERTASLSFVYNEATLQVFKKIKECWDPESIFNPSKKIHITKDYLVSRTAHSLE